MKSNYFANGSYKKAKKLILKQSGFATVGMFGLKEQNLGTILNLIHGRDGEDGKIASLLEFNGIKYISPRVEASVLSYNKLYTKLYAKSVGVEVVEYQHLNKNDKREINFECPVIIKPVRLGSSIGVSIVKSDDELEYALDVAFEFDDDVIIEPFIQGVAEYNQAGTFTNVTKPIESHEGDVDGAQSAGTLTITMKSGNTLVEGDLVIIDDVYYRLSAGDDTSITLQSELVKDVAADTNIKNSSYTSTYKGDVQIADAVGLVDVIISHPEMDDTILKYNIVNDTLAEKIDKVGTGARRMVASA